ncbi:receptor-like kinase LIP2 isoform X2 [Hevea brasiliensis]|uniref:receptor-like kinase LIP2 isoform X2 n=1 Tax=Hevea brasiliensis TaxID=3981 RepID=UPI0025E0308C|nr:receptor-like kinase LIP2 isoform X2 [Hevea brasiliensis]
MATSQSTGPFGPREYTYEQLAEAAHHFSNKYLLGQGGFGQVYEGSLHGEKFAIKKLRFPPDEQTKKGLDEIHVISSVRHRNLVKLLGYCVDRSNNVLLVLEYFRNKSLKVNLHEKEEILDWQKRRKIAIGSAKGLEYLHDHCSPTIIHQDIKPDNILLDDNFEPKIADFGLARIFTDHNTHISMSQVGTEIYMDPECSGKVTDKVDVYSFGVVLLELITGRKPKYQGNIVTWAGSQIKKALGGEFKDFVDFKLQKYDKEEMKRMVHCAAFCVYKRPKFRPPMRKIVRALEGDMPLANLSDEMIDNQLPHIIINEDNNNVDFLHHMVQKLFPQEMGTLDFLHSQHYFRVFRAKLQADPNLLQPLLQELGSQKPQILRFIQEHQDDFLRFINQPVEGGEGNIIDLEQLQAAMTRMVIVTPIERVEAMRYDRASASNPVVGLNANPLYPFPQGVPSAAGAVPINFFRNDPQFQAFRARVQASPHLLDGMLQHVGNQNPHALRFIQEHWADFIHFINEPIEGGQRNILALGQPQPAMPQMGVPSAAGAGPINFFRYDPRFQELRARVQASPHLLNGMLQHVGSQNPHALRFIQEHWADFLHFINEPVGRG